MQPRLSCAVGLQVSMNEMMAAVSSFDGGKLPIRHIPGPEGVRGRNSDNARILERLGWEPTVRLEDGLKITYGWIKKQLLKVPYSASVWRTPQLRQNLQNLRGFPDSHHVS